MVPPESWQMTPQTQGFPEQSATSPSNEAEGLRFLRVKSYEKSSAQVISMSNI